MQPIARVLCHVGVGALALLLVGCPPTLDPGDPSEVVESALFRFSSCGELRDWVTESWVETLVQARYGEAWNGTLEGDNGDSAAADGPARWSETNVQEAGVDEPDLVKTDGEHIYVAQRGELTVVDSWPPGDTAKIASLPLEGWPFALFLREDRAIVLARHWGESPEPWAEGGYEAEVTSVHIVDVSDPTHPVLLRNLEFEGSYVDARRIDGDLYVVVNRHAWLPYELWDMLWSSELGLPPMLGDVSAERREAIRAEARGKLLPVVRELVDGMPLETLLPQYRDRTPGNGEPSEALLGCTDVFRPAGLSQTSVLALTHVDLDAGNAGGPPSATGLMADGWLVYASEARLYVAQSSWWWWWGWDPLDLVTHIHRFSLAGTETTYEASGSVPGWILNRFSMGEHAGRLRIATTDADWWWGVDSLAADEPATPANNVFVLGRAGAELQIVGEVRGIAPDEQIYAARFLGDRGFLVTFEVIDPLITLDLSDPTAPRVVGELEVPGYSSYLHPVGEDHLLAVGMDGTPEGQITGFAVSLFDVSDFAAPSLVDRFTLQGDDWSWSESLWEPHAFTYYDGVLSVPIYVSEGGVGFSGLLVLDVDLVNGLQELGRIDHSDLVEDSQCLYGSEWEEPWGDSCADGWWYAEMRRSVVVDGALYSLSDYGIKVNEHREPATELARVLFWPL